MELYFIEENKLVGFMWKKKYKGQADTDTKTEEKLWKRNQIMITALALMIAIAGYLNFMGKKVDEVRVNWDWLWVSDCRNRVMEYTILFKVFEHFQNINKKWKNWGSHSL